MYKSRSPLHQVVLLEIQLENGVLDGRKHKANILRVGGAGEMGINDLIAVGVQLHEHLENELPGGLGIALGTCPQEKVRKNTQGSVSDATGKASKDNQLEESSQ